MQLYIVIFKDFVLKFYRKGGSLKMAKEVKKEVKAAPAKKAAPAPAKKK